MRHRFLLFAIAALCLSACENKAPEGKRFPDAKITFQYREYEPFKVEFVNTSTPDELEAYIWRFGSGTQARSDEHPICKYPHRVEAYNVVLTCIDQYRLSVPYDSTYYDNVYYSDKFLYQDSATVYVTGVAHENWTEGGAQPE